MAETTDPISKEHDSLRSKSKFHYLQALFIFLVFTVVVRENSILFTPLTGVTFLALAYLIRYINKPIFPPKAWLTFKVIVYILLVLSLGITPI